MDSPSQSRNQAARNLAAVKRGWEALNAGAVTAEDIRAGELAPVLEVLDRGVVVDVTDVGVPGIAVYRGHRGVRQFWIDWFEAVDDVHTDVLASQAAGDKVISVCRQTGTGIASGAAVMWEFAMVFTLRDGLVVRMDMYAEVDDARRAAGLPAPRDEAVTSASDPL